MATTTTNFGWDIPQSTDLVKDGATAIAALGQDIDTALVDLKGGTTGQVLSKATNTDLDYAWVTPEIGDITAVNAGTGLTGGGTTGAVSLAIDSTVATLTDTQTLTNKTLTSPVLTTPTISTIDAKGDLLAGTADNTVGRLAVGANNTVLTADSSTATGLKWATPATSTSGLTLIKSQTIGTAVSSVTVTDAFSATYDNYLITINGGSASATSNTQLTFGSTTSGYYWAGYYMLFTSSTVNGFNTSNGANFTGSYYSGDNHSSWIYVQNPYLSKTTICNTIINASSTSNYIANYNGYLNNTTSYTAFTLTPFTGTLTGGTIRVYGYQNS